MNALGIILTGAVFCAPLVVLVWAAGAMAGQADEDMGAKVPRRRR